jgi:hypothetical protein
MAAPIIDSVTATPSTIAPGGTTRVVIVAHDTDEQVIALVAAVKDSQGNETPAQVSIHIGDPLTYSLTGPAGWTITPVPGSPNAFDCKAP